MKFYILTLFPEMFEGLLNTSIIKRAIGKNVIDVEIKNIRDYTLDKYNRVDTPPIGGGAGLIMKCQPIVDCLSSLTKTHKILLDPKGETFNQNKAKELSKLDSITLLCGHYEGIDSRIEKYVDEKISLGDFVLTGGELGAMVIIDAVSRLLEGAITNESLSEESFDNNLLEYPQYTEPYNFNGDKVPDILYSGNHKAINKWRRKESLKLTLKNRPDLFKKLTLSKEDKKLLEEIKNGTTPKWEMDAIIKGHKFIKKD